VKVKHFKAGVGNIITIMQWC